MFKEVGLRDLHTWRGEEIMVKPVVELPSRNPAQEGQSLPLQLGGTGPVFPLMPQSPQL